MPDDTMQPPKPDLKAKPADKPKKKGGRRGKFNALLVLVVIGSLALFIWAEQQRRDAIKRLESTTQELEEIRTISQRTGAAVTSEVLERVRNHMRIPDDPRPTVATITDVDALRQDNAFYQQAKNGDHLIITPARAILYDPDADRVVDVVPVRIERRDTTGQTAEEAPAEETTGGEGQ